MKPRRAAWASISLLMIFALGCGEEAGEAVRQPTQETLPSDHGMLRLAGGFPSLHARTFLFSGDGVRQTVQVPEGGGELRFSVYGMNDGQGEYQVSIRSGESRRVLYSDHALPIGVPELPRDQTLERIGEDVRINLDEFAGMTLDVEWKGPDDAVDGAFAVAGMRCVARQMESSRPHILVICVDTLRVDFATEGEGSKWMPELNEFAREAMVYERAYSTASWTLPAMVSLFTGLWPMFHRAGQFPEPGARLESSTPYNPMLLSLPEYLREKGYATYFLHTNPYLFHSSLYADGFDYALGAPFEVGQPAGDLACELIERTTTDEPVFVFIHLMDPHRYKEIQFKTMFPGVQPEYSDQTMVRAAYGESVRQTDVCIGRILDAWKSKLSLDQSLVIITSDHGEHLFDPGHPPITQEEFKSMNLPLHIFLPLLSHGSSMEDALLHVPLVAKFPSAVRVGGGTSAAAVSLMDIFPTVAWMLGEDPAALGLQGVPLFPLPDVQDSERRVFHANLQPYADMLSSVRRGNLKLVINHTRQTRQLFDMTRVRTELGEPGGEITDEVNSEELFGLFQAHENEAAMFLVPEHIVPTPDARISEDLRKLGYVQ